MGVDGVITTTYIMCFQLFLSAIRLLVLEVELEITEASEDKDQESGGYTSVQTGLIPSWRVLGPENEGTSDAADASESDHGCTAECAFPLAADVIGLVGHDGRNVGVGTGC